MSDLISLVAKHGPFPLGIIVGMIFHKWAMNSYIKAMEREKEALRAEKAALLELIETKDDRIEALHQRLQGE